MTNEFTLATITWILYIHGESGKVVEDQNEYWYLSLDIMLN